jgi:hypothetical protein
MTASSVDAPDAPIEGLLAELDSNANTNWSFSKVAYRSPSLFVKGEEKMSCDIHWMEEKKIKSIQKITGR